MAKSFLKTKGAMKSLPAKAVNAGLRIGGAAGAGYLSNKVIGEKIPKRWHGLTFLALGLAGELFIENDKVNALAQGITTYGGLQVIAKNLLPNEAASFGLSGDDEDFAAYEELEGFDDTPAEYEEEAAAAAELEGVEDAMEMLAGADRYTPEELEMAANL